MSYSLWGQIALATLMLSFGVAGGWEMHALLARPWTACAFTVAGTKAPPSAPARPIMPAPAGGAPASDWRSVTDF